MMKYTFLQQVINDLINRISLIYSYPHNYNVFENFIN